MLLHQTQAIQFVEATAGVTSPDQVQRAVKHASLNAGFDRPKYGAVNLFDTKDGACPRFGSCYLSLRPEISRRCTLSYGDSHDEPAARGTPGTPGPLLIALSRDFTGKAVDADINTSIVQHSRRLRQNPGTKNRAMIPQGRILDGYVEAQLHGVLSLSSDVLHLSADSAFLGTRTGIELVELANACKIELEWRPALVLSVGPIPTSFRGNALTSFVESIRKDGQIDVAHLGEVARSVVSEPAFLVCLGNQTRRTAARQANLARHGRIRRTRRQHRSHCA